MQDYNNDGWVASNKIPSNPQEALPAYVNNFKENRVPNNIIDGLMRRVEKWTKQGIIVFGVRPPSTAEMVKLEEALSGFDESDFVQKFIKAGGIWIPVDTAGLESYDGSHLERKSAIAFSKQLGKKVQNHLNRRNK